MAKRITIFSGHYGSGKTNIALSHAYRLRESHKRVAIADIDIVNPYFRTKDSEEELKARDIRLICSAYANTNLDIPALPQDMYAVTDDRELYAVLDVGGDERGALALGRLAPAIREEDNYEMLCVVNGCRPLTRTAADTLEIMREIEAASGLRFTGIVNNSNLGSETTPELVRSYYAYGDEVAALSGLPLLYTVVPDTLAACFQNEDRRIQPIPLQKKL